MVRMSPQLQEKKMNTKGCTAWYSRQPKRGFVPTCTRATAHVVSAMGLTTDCSSTFFPPDTREIHCSTDFSKVDPLVSIYEMKGMTTSRAARCGCSTPRGICCSSPNAPAFAFEVTSLSLQGFDMFAPMLNVRGTWFRHLGRLIRRTGHALPADAGTRGLGIKRSRHCVR